MFDLSVIIRLIRMRFSVGVFRIFSIWFAGKDDISFYAALVTNRFWEPSRAKANLTVTQFREPFATTEHFFSWSPFFRHKLFEISRRLYCDPVRWSASAPLFSVARYPCLRRKRWETSICQRVVKIFFLTLDTVFFQRFICLSVA